MIAAVAIWSFVTFTSAAARFLAASAVSTLARRKPKSRTVLQDVLFKPGDIVQHGEEAEEDEKKEKS